MKSVRDKLESSEYDNPIKWDTGHRWHTASGAPSSRQAHVEAEYEIVERFRRDLLAEHSVSDHPKAEDVWRLAWERGHSSGLYQVITDFEELVGLIKP